MRSRDGLPFGHPGCPVTGKRAGKFIDTGKVMLAAPNKRVPLLIHEAAVLILGRHIGMLDRDAAADKDAEVIELKQRVQALERDLAEADAFIDAEEVVRRNNLRITRPPGRPKKTPNL